MEFQYSHIPHAFHCYIPTDTVHANISFILTDKLIEYAPTLMICRIYSCSPFLPPLQADVYVNTAHKRLDLNLGAVAQSLLRSGGPALQAECNQYIAQHGSVPVWGYATTGGGNLRCKHVIHGVGTDYDGPGGSAEKVCFYIITLTRCMTRGCWSGLL